MACRRYTFTTPAGVWTVYRVPGSHEYLRTKPGGRLILGLTVYAERCIYINTDVEPALQEETELHEQIHAALMGARIPRGIEERVVHKLDARLLPVLKQFGYRQPARHARRRR